MLVEQRGTDEGFRRNIFQNSSDDRRLRYLSLRGTAG
jgi:hypothetical protein